MADEIADTAITYPMPLVLWSWGARRLEVRSLAGERFALLIEGAQICGVYRLPARPKAS